jgi:hydrogenase nickel incorporation protein HypA/HybF
MHELSISSAIVATAIAHADGRPISVVSVRIGHLRQAIPSSLRFYFGIVTRETIAEGAELELEIVPGRLQCQGCGHGWEVEYPAFRCPRCAGGDVVVFSGNELEVESIQVEDPACIV